MMHWPGKVLILLFFAAMVGAAQSQVVVERDLPVPLIRILFVFDASQSMANHWQSDTKYRIAINVLSGILDSLQGQENLEIGLRVYGPKRAPGPDCEDSYIMVPFGTDNFSSIRSVLHGLSPSGTTPIAYSLEQTASDFPPCSHCRNIVILITDGLEACGGDPCQVSKELQRKGIFLRPFIVGIGENMQAQFNCMGNYYNAVNENDYRRALQTIVASTLKAASAQINLLDRFGNPSQTDVHVTLYNTITGTAKYSFVHTLNPNGLPDTLELDPLVTYDVVVQTIPPLRKEAVWIEPGEHTTITLDARQGYLSFISEDEKVFSCIIRRSGTGKAIHVQPSDRMEKYLAGNYDITVLTMPRMNFSNVEIAADQITQLRIPATGAAMLKYSAPVVGSIYMEVAGELLLVEHLRSDNTTETMQLQPGNYIIVYRLKSSHRQQDTRQKQFKVEAGETVEVEL